MYESDPGNVLGNADAAYASWNTSLFYDPPAVYSEEDTAGDSYEFFRPGTG